MLTIIGLVGVLTLSFTAAYESFNPGRAEAITTICDKVRCTYYLDKKESYDFAYGSYNPIPPANPYFALAVFLKQGLAIFGRYYVDHGYCLAFRVSAIPWDTQSLFPYRGCS
jgi:hypothetical protein